MRHLAGCAVAGLVLWGVSLQLPVSTDGRGQPAQHTFDEANAAWERRDYATALAAFRVLAESGDPRAQHSLGIMHAQGHGVPKDYDEALRWFRKAAEQGFAASQLNLGAMYAEGLGVEKSEAQAERWFLEAAQQGDPLAQYNLATLYAMRPPIGRHAAEAVPWYRKAAEQGVGLAQLALGSAYLAGRGIEKDVAEAVRWYRRAAEGGDGAAQYSLAYLYAEGVDVPRDDEEAVAWMGRALETARKRSQETASKEQPGEAEHGLGMAFEIGVQLGKDDAAAARWYRRAAEKGNPYAQHSLGVMYSEGRGVSKDRAEGARWIAKAAALGYTAAPEGPGPSIGNALTPATRSKGHYEPPSRNFRIPLPDWPGLNIQELPLPDGGRVAFTSDFGEVWAITYRKMSAEVRRQLRDPAKREAVYKAFLNDDVMRNIILPRAPNATIVHEEFVHDSRERIYFAAINTPERSGMRRNDKWLDSVRGLIVFSEHDYLYMVEAEMNTALEEIKFGAINPRSPDRRRRESVRATLQGIRKSIVTK